MNDWNADIIRGLLLEAAATALSHYDSPDISLKGDRTIVTQADREIENLLAGSFDRPEEGSYLIGEETVERRDENYITAAFRNTAWVVDPIDGTVPYAHHLPTWGISIGMMRNGTIEEGAVFLPATGELFHTDAGLSYYTVVKPGTGGEAVRLPVRKEPPGESGLVAISQNIARNEKFALPNPVVALCCAVVPMTYLTLGRVMVYLASLKLWDLAGAAAVLYGAGLPIYHEDGTPFPLSVDGKTYRLDRDDPKRWYTRKALVCVPSRDVFEYIKGTP